MDIYYLGHSAFRLKGKSAVVVTDPFDPKATGFGFPKIDKVDIVTVSHDHADHNFLQAFDQAVLRESLLINGPGEYEKSQVGIVGVPSFHDGDKGVKRGPNTIYEIVIDGVRIVHLGDLGHKLSEETLSLFEEVDILLVPTGGVYTIDAKQAWEIVLTLSPKIVIPMHYKTAKHNEKVFGDLSPVADFLKLADKVDLPALNKFPITKDKLPLELQVILLSAV